MTQFKSSSSPVSIPPTTEYRGGFCEAVVTTDGKLYATWINPDDRVLIVEPSSRHDHAIILEPDDIPAFIDMLEKTRDFLRILNGDDEGGD